MSSERYRRALMDLCRLPGNDSCADCGFRTVAWASWTLGVFLCTSCAQHHRRMGTHLSKVKSLQMDEWNKEQVDGMRQGNLAKNSYFNPTGETLSSLGLDFSDASQERFIRQKYETQTFRRRALSKAIPERSVSPAVAQTIDKLDGIGRTPPLPRKPSLASVRSQPQSRPAQQPPPPQRPQETQAAQAAPAPQPTAQRPAVPLQYLSPTPSYPSPYQPLLSYPPQPQPQFVAQPQQYSPPFAQGSWSAPGAPVQALPQQPLLQQPYYAMAPAYSYHPQMAYQQSPPAQPPPWNPPSNSF